MITIKNILRCTFHHSAILKVRKIGIQIVHLIALIFLYRFQRTVIVLIKGMQSGVKSGRVQNNKKHSSRPHTCVFYFQRRVKCILNEKPGQLNFVRRAHLIVHNPRRDSSSIKI
jgi:hypothetical protein